MSEVERDDREIEQALRAILDPLDRHLNLGNLALGFALVVIVPATFLILWLGELTNGKYAAGWAGGAFVIIVLLGVSWDSMVGWSARRHFNRLFPLGHPKRAVAFRMLNEMETPSKGEEKLRESLQAASPERIIRHHRDHPDKAIEDGEKPIDAPSPASSVSSALPPPVPPHVRPGGYYDYIPLEPRVAPPLEEEKDRP